MENTVSCNNKNSFCEENLSQITYFLEEEEEEESEEIEDLKNKLKKRKEDMLKQIKENNKSEKKPTVKK